MQKKRLVIIGGGAAGFFCAVNAAAMSRNLEVIILEKSQKVLSKVKVSGGGRCNVTHHCFSIADMVKKYPRGGSFLKKAFHHFFTTDTIRWFEERGVQLKAEADGRMFPVSDSSQTIIDCLLKEANRYGVQLWMNGDVKELEQEGAGWRIITKDNRNVYADFICISSGGFPKEEQFNWIKATGHSIEQPVPSLFTLNMPGNPVTELMGVSVEQVKVKIAATKLESAGPLLITHWGMSGPAVLRLSAFAARELASRNWHCTVVINWLPAYNENSLREKLQQLRFENASRKIHNGNVFGLPQRLWQFILQSCGIAEDMRWADLPAKEQHKLIKNLCTAEFEVKGKTTFKEEFVTAGGVQLSEIDVNTMQSKLAPGLYFAGEVLNVDGITGGFNFQNAWTTGWIAAKGIAHAVQ